MENAAESKWQDGFGKRLQMVREKMGISRQALAERLMIPVYHLEAIEEKGLPISKTLKEMAQKELNIDDKNRLWLWTGTGEMPNIEALPQAAEDTPPANNVQAFCHERPIAECLYYAMDALINADYVLFAQKGVETAACAGAIAAGVSVVTSIVRMAATKRASRQQKP